MEVVAAMAQNGGVVETFAIGVGSVLSGIGQAIGGLLSAIGRLFG